MSRRHPYPIGTKVRVEGFPTITGSSVVFDYNGLAGEVRFVEHIGEGLGGLAVYQYLVHFKDVKIPFANRNPITRKLDRGFTTGDAENLFEQEYLEAIENDTHTTI